MKTYNRERCKRSLLTLSVGGDFKSFFTAFHKLKAYQNSDVRKMPFVSRISLLGIKIAGLVALSVGGGSGKLNLSFCDHFSSLIHFT